MPLLPGTAFTQKNVGNFATSSVEGPEKTLRCRWGNSNTRIQYVRNYLAHTRISCGKFLRFSTKSEKQNVYVLYSNMVYLCRYRKFTVFYPSGQILPHLFSAFLLPWHELKEAADFLLVEGHAHVISLDLRFVSTLFDFDFDGDVV